jgi:hypothetical protein
MSERERRAGFLLCMANYVGVSVELDADGDGLSILFPPQLAEFNTTWWTENIAAFGDEIFAILVAEGADDAPQRLH